MYFDDQFCLHENKPNLSNLALRKGFEAVAIPAAKAPAIDGSFKDSCPHGEWQGCGKDHGIHEFGIQPFNQVAVKRATAGCNVCSSGSLLSSFEASLAFASRSGRSHPSWPDEVPYTQVEK